MEQEHLNACVDLVLSKEPVLSVPKSVQKKNENVTVPGFF